MVVAPAANARLMGTLFTTPPSTRTSSPAAMGGKIPGIAADARMASTTGPSLNQPLRKDVVAPEVEPHVLEPLHPLSGWVGAVGAAVHGPDGGAEHEVSPDAPLDQLSQHADLHCASRPATGQHEGRELRRPGAPRSAPSAEQPSPTPARPLRRCGRSTAHQGCSRSAGGGPG